MTFAMFLTWIVVAAVTGGAASAIIKRRGQGTMADIILALMGGGLACGGAVASDLFPQFGLVATALIAFAGACVAIGIQRRFAGGSAL
jgi:uncharacterized membrane protein YeaQ/YmgE (transglycosylase-associated protein family)